MNISEKMENHIGFQKATYTQTKKCITAMLETMKMGHNVKALLSVAEIEKQKLNYAEKFI